jgi:hypothetical protein
VVLAIFMACRIRAEKGFPLAEPPSVMSGESGVQAIIASLNLIGSTSNASYSKCGLQGLQTGHGKPRLPSEIVANGVQSLA